MAPERDRFVPRDGEAYADALARLLPRGPAWPREPGSVLMRFVRGLAEMFGRVDTRAAHLLVREADPARATELLDEWERVTGLPDPCVPQTLTTPERRQAVVNRLAMRGGQSKAYFIGVAAELGYAITITEFAPFMFGASRMGDERWSIGAPSMRFYWRINVPDPRITWFRFGQGRMGQDPHLRIARAEDLECVLGRLKPAHSILQFSYEGA